MEVFVEAKETIWNIHRKTMISSLSPEVCLCLFVHLSVPNGFRTLPPEVKLRLCHHLISMSWMIVGEEDKMRKKKERDNLWINPQPPRPPVPPGQLWYIYIYKHCPSKCFLNKGLSLVDHLCGGGLHQFRKTAGVVEGIEERYTFTWYIIDVQDTNYHLF